MVNLLTHSTFVTASSRVQCDIHLLRLPKEKSNLLAWSLEINLTLTIAVRLLLECLAVGHVLVGHPLP